MESTAEAVIRLDISVEFRHYCAVILRAKRIIAFLIDAILALVIGGLLFSLIPLVGMLLGRILLFSYMLLRDVTGASLGKRLLGLRVVLQDGNPSTSNECISRNVTIAIGPAILLIPFGSDLGPPVWGCCLLIETLVLLVRGERLGDMFTFTKVVRKDAEAAGETASREWAGS